VVIWLIFVPLIGGALFKVIYSYVAYLWECHPLEKHGENDS
jgi:hypothetical protein